MAESRRVQLTTLPCDVPSSADKPASAPKDPPGVLQGKENGSDRPAGTDTVRLVLTLFEPDERSFPEFSYSQLVDNKINLPKEDVPLSRFEEEEKRENDEIAAISRKLEKKYGNKPKKKDRIQDLIDIGYGYDDEDSFIDNSEAYDEFVPAALTTKFGGFYINSGVLQFRHASETEDLTMEEETLEPSKKRKVNGTHDKPKKKRHREGGEMMSSVAVKSRTSSEIGPDDVIKKKKKKKVAATLSVTSMLRKFQREKEKERQNMEKANKKPVTIPLCPADAGGGGGSGLTDPLLNLIGSTTDHALIQAANTVDFDIDLDSLLDVSDGSSSPKVIPQPATELFRPKTEDVTPSDAAPQVNQPPNTKTNLQLKRQSEQIQLLAQTSSPQSVPEGLPPRLEDSIRKLMVVAKTSEGESKLKFFTPEINSILLEIELQCREQGGPLRSKVYTHLSSFLPFQKDTLLKRVKKLLLAHIMEEPPEAEDPMQKLKEAIGRAMPEQIACFQENCQTYEQVKTSKAAEDEEEGKQKMNVGSEENVEEKGGRRSGPRKMFKWNEEIRESLCHVLTEKMERHKQERKGSQEMEEYMKTLLDNEVKPLWPKGWMQSRVLIRESKKMLSLFTSLPVKRARPEKKQPSVTAPSAAPSAAPPLKDDVFIESSNISSCTPLGTEKKQAAVLKKAEGKTGGGVTVDAGSSTPADKPPAAFTSAPAHSLLDILADQALAREQPLSVSQELLAAAVAKYKRSGKHWSFGLDTKSPPFPPPPPQSSPVGFPLVEVPRVVLPQLLQVGDFSRPVEDDHILVISDDDDDVIMP